MDSNQLINFLTILLGIMTGVLFILCVVFLILKIKSKEPKKKTVSSKKTDRQSTKNVVSQSYSK